MRVALLLLATVASPPASRQAIGVYHGWGAFRDAAPVHCYAIARAIVAGGHGRAFASVATWPGRGVRSSLHIRLSRRHDGTAPVTLSIGERRFVLVARDQDAWAADNAGDRAIVAAIRAGRSMSVEAVSWRHVPFADVYALGGAATAIDAAAIACARG